MPRPGCLPHGPGRRSRGLDEPRLNIEGGMSVRRAAVVAVVALLLANVCVPIAEFVIWPSIVDLSDIEQTVANIRANQGGFLFASFAYVTAFAGDIVVAWALYYLLRPVSRSLAALAAALRAAQGFVAVGAALHLFTAF